MLAKKANLNRCGLRCKAEVRHFCVVTKWRQMAIVVYKRATFVLSIPFFDPYISCLSELDSAFLLKKETKNPKTKTNRKKN